MLTLSLLQVGILFGAIFVGLFIQPYLVDWLYFYRTNWASWEMASFEAAVLILSLITGVFVLAIDFL